MYENLQFERFFLLAHNASAHYKRYITSYCKKNDFLVDIVAYDDGCALLNAYSKENYQVLFLDIVMEGISGIEAARKIREQKQSVKTILWMHMV